MGWLDLVTNPQGLRDIFQGDVPSLEGVTLHEISIDREGPALRLRLDLPGYPADPPARWRRGGFNTVQVELLFGGVRDLSLAGISTEMLVNVEIQRQGDVIVDVSSPAVRVAAAAGSVTISRLEAYLDGAREVDVS